MRTIGIVGGVGPYAGLDLAKKIFDNTAAQRDQEHLDVLLVNCPRLIDDRTDYILAVRDGQVTADPAIDLANPGYGIVACIRKLAAAGAEVVGIPCNTAHAPLIFDVVEREVASQLPAVRLLHLISETMRSVCACLPRVGTIGLLATLGTYASGVYQTCLAKADLGGDYRILEPDKEGQYRIHAAIYNRDYGIKAHSTPVSSRAIDDLTTEVWRLHRRGADVVIMGCTEIPLALDHGSFPCPLIDPALVFARALIRECGLPGGSNTVTERVPSVSPPWRQSNRLFPGSSQV